MAKNKIKKKNNKHSTTTTKNYINNFNFTNGESFMRMNYLFKISEINYNQKEKKNIEDNKNNQERNILSHLYISIMKDISKRNAIRVNKYVKKICCQKCNNLLFKDSNSEIKFTNKNGKKIMEIICGECNTLSNIIYL